MVRPTTDEVMVIKHTWGLLIALSVTLACAQTPVDAPEWVEEAPPPAPAYTADRLIPIEMPPYVTLKIGIDPTTLVVAADGIVRYVVVMRNASGSAFAAYEGILCSSGEVKTYARTGSSGKWVPVEQPQWRDMTDNLPSRHAFALSKQGVCNGRVAAKRADILATLKQGQKSYE